MVADPGGPHVRFTSSHPVRPKGGKNDLQGALLGGLRLGPHSLGQDQDQDQGGGVGQKDYTALLQLLLLLVC